MSRFRFRLERVLGVRRIEEELARAQWLEAEQAATLAESEARATQASLDEARARLGALQSRGRLRAHEVLLEQGLVERLRERLVQRTIQASRLRREAERLRLDMSERRVRVRGLESLESRGREEWRQEREKAANAELDERAGLARAHAASRPDARPTDERAPAGAGTLP